MVSLARSRWIIASVLLVSIASVWWVRRRPKQFSAAYVNDRAAIMWSTMAQVRQPVITLHYGQQVAVVQRSGDQAEVRTDSGLSGWVDANQLMDPDLWQRAAAGLAKAREMPVQAVGHTRAPSNVHIEPGRDSQRIYQFGRNVPLAVVGRKVAAAPASSQSSADNGATSGDEPQKKTEDWLLVLRSPSAGSILPGAGTSPAAVSTADPGASADTPIAGWMLAQFLELDPPPPIPDYTNASGVRPLAWALLNRAPDASGDKPQYVVAGVRGAQSAECDFNALRVFTWGAARQRYETAYIENDLCGSLPLTAREIAGGAEFRFPEADEGNAERIYRMQQTSVRRVRPVESPRH